MGVPEAETPLPLVSVIVTFVSTSPKLVEPTVAVAPLPIVTPVLENLIVVPVSAPLPRGPEGRSKTKLTPPQSPAAGVQVVKKAEGHIARPTLLSRPVVIVAPPAVASSVAPWNVSELCTPTRRVFTTAFAGRVSVFPGLTVSVFTSAYPRG